VDVLTLSDAAVRAWGDVAARLGRALRGFTHPAASRVMLWDPQHALELRAYLDAVSDPDTRALVTRALDRFEANVAPIWHSLRSQVIHGDLSEDNVLVDEADGSITGIIDFGDMAFTALAVDAASVIEALVAGRTDDEVFRIARIVLDGFQKVVPLEAEELAILGDLIAARACAAIVVPAFRGALYESPDALMPVHRTDGIALLELVERIGPDEVTRRLGGRELGEAETVAQLIERRRGALGSAITALSYEEPLHIVRGEGPWLFDADGGRYLDAYNNVPVIGHAHPRVTEAIVRQARRLNTNMRYLHGAVLELAERLIATTEGELDVVMFVNSGSEANDLAWRLATTATGHSGGLCTSFAYHGVSEAITALSPEVWPRKLRPPHVETWSPPDTYRGTHLEPSEYAGAIERLAGHGHKPAATILDGVLTSDGVLDLDPAYVQELVRLTHEAGGLWIADEVQGGYGRTGEAMWSYQRFGITPDFVTLGKPMGNGHPVAAVITRSDIIDRFAETTDYFSTFGGNPVATRAALAVLDVIEDERILANALSTGELLRDGLRGLAASYPAIGEVRGMGLATGLEFVVDPQTKEPDPDTADRVMNELRRRGVLVGTTGAQENSLKIRPPLVFGPREADLLVSTLRDVLAAPSSGPAAAPARA